MTLLLLLLLSADCWNETKLLLAVAGDTGTTEQLLLKYQGSWMNIYARTSIVTLARDPSRSRDWLGILAY